MKCVQVRLKYTFLLLTVFLPWVANAEEVKKLTSLDLAIQTHRWDGKIVESRFQCLYADKNEFRCLGGFAAVRVDFSTLEPAAIRKKIENTCDTHATFILRRCAFTIQFSYGSFEALTKDNGAILHVVNPVMGYGLIVQE